MVEKTRRGYEEVKQQKKILISKLGAMGDLVLAVPSFRMIRKRFPTSHISLLVDPKLIPVVQNCPYLNELIGFDRASSEGQWTRLFKVARRLRERSFDFSVDLQSNWRTQLLSFLARIPKRYGFKRGKLSFLLTHPVFFSDPNLGPVQHQFQLLKKTGVIQLEESLELWSDPEADRYLDQKMSDAGMNSSKLLIGFVIGASSRWPTKKWPAENFVELAKQLMIKYDCNIVLVGTQEDHVMARSFEEVPRNRILDMTGETNLTQLMSLMKCLDVIVTGDTAPLHMASAFGAKVVALFGPTEPKRHAPPGRNRIILVKRIPCQPCYRGTCRNPVKLECLKGITVREVFEAVESHMAQVNRPGVKV